jgi:hypothetical protein
MGREGEYRSLRVTRARRDRTHEIEKLRVRHVAGTRLDKVIDDLQRLGELGPIAVAEFLERKARTIRDAESTDRGKMTILREVPIAKKRVVKANRLARAGIRETRIDRECGISKWIGRVDATITLATVLTLIDRSRLGSGQLVAYELVGTIRNVSLSADRVKKLFNLQKKRS